ncbi:MAG: hypothetical protein MUE33_08905 [Cytophagaceae bacterium]|nr:hypothetical protein [Cytophagaceae bacterium]
MKTIWPTSLKMVSYFEKKSTIFFFSYLLLYVIFLLLFVGLDHRPWTDEYHFHRTIRLFITSPNLQTLKTYEEMSTPLPFILYALWSKLGTVELEWLRVFSLLIFCTTSIVLRQYLALFSTPWLSNVGILLFSLNPYIIGLSLFVYTDMLCILFFISALYFYKNKNYHYMALSITAAIACRQYAVFLPIGLFITLLIENNFRYRVILKPTVYLLASLMPFIPLVLLWNGIHPDNNLHKLYIPYAFSYHPSATVAYIISLFLYSIPISLLVLFTSKVSSKVVAISIFLSILYWIIPVRPSECSVEGGFTTIGLIDKALHTILAETCLIDCFYFIAFGLGIYFLGIMTLENIRYKKYLTVVIILCYLAVMPFSYITWEKYILPLLPVVLAWGLDKNNQWISFLCNRFPILRS